MLKVQHNLLCLGMIVISDAIASTQYSASHIQTFVIFGEWAKLEANPKTLNI